MDEASIERLAEQELLQEAKRGAARASVDGPAGWHKCPLPRTNKRFLHNTILHSLQSNRTSARRGRDVGRKYDAGDRRQAHTRSNARGENRFKSGDKTLCVQSKCVGKKSDKNVSNGVVVSSEKKDKKPIVVQGSSHNDDPVK